jgi:DNA-nicking Smr family endonuclease
MDDEDAIPAEVSVPITDVFDLHSFAPSDQTSVLEEYLLQCRERGILLVRVIHGRGKGVQRASVWRALRDLGHVESFTTAPAESGGWGATLVRLRPK